MSSSEFKDAMIMVDGLTDKAVADELEEMAKDALTLFDSTDPTNAERREIFLYKATVLSAAASRLRHGIRDGSAYPEGSGEDGEVG